VTAPDGTALESELHRSFDPWVRDHAERIDGISDIGYDPKRYPAQRLEESKTEAGLMKWVPSKVFLWVLRRKLVQVLRSQEKAERVIGTFGDVAPGVHCSRLGRARADAIARRRAAPPVAGRPRRLHADPRPPASTGRSRSMSGRPQHLERAPSDLDGVRYGAIARHGDTRGAFRELWRASAFPTLTAVETGAPEDGDFSFPREYLGVYLQRRRESGFQLYNTLGIARGDKAAYAKQALENYNFFGAPHVAIVNRAFAEAYFKDGNAIGQSILMGPQYSIRIVGQVGDVPIGNVDERIPPTLYLPFAQDPDTRSVLITQNRDKTSILLTRQSKAGK